MFDPKGFSPVHVNAGAMSPRMFSYFHPEDLLSEIMKPGYFNSKKMIMRPNSFIKVVCKDAVAEFCVLTNIGELTFREEFFKAVDPYKELKKPIRRRRTKHQIAADRKRQLPKTG